MKSAPRAKLAHDRLLRIGFAFFVKPDSQHNTELSTTNQLTLPRRP